MLVKSTNMVELIATRRKQVEALTVNFKEETMRTYDKKAASFAESYFNATLPNGIYLDFTSLLNGRRILDSGSGSGRDTQYFISQGYEVTSIDISQGMINEAEKRVPAGNFQRMDMSDLKSTKACFDGIWCCASLFHLEKLEAAKTLDGFRMALMDNGVLYLSIRTSETQGFTGDAFEHGRFFAGYTREEIASLVTVRFYTAKRYETKDQHGREWLNIIAKPK